MRNSVRRSARRTAIAGLLLVPLAIAAFWAGRELGQRDPAAANPGDPPIPADLDSATPAPGETPNPRDPYSLVKWMNQDEQLPRYDITVAGIRIGLNAVRQVPDCHSVAPEVASFAEVRGTRLDIVPRYLPPGAELTGSLAVRCGQTIVFAELTYELRAADDIQDRIDAGEDFWTLPRGGTIQIYRFVGAPSEASSIPPARWSATTVAGHEAAFGRPVLPEGLGDSEVMVYTGRVLTVVRTANLSSEEILAVAEGVVGR